MVHCNKHGIKIHITDKNECKYQKYCQSFIIIHLYVIQLSTQNSIEFASKFISPAFTAICIYKHEFVSA